MPDKLEQQVPVKVREMDKPRLKTELQYYGVRVKPGTLAGRNGGAGPAEGIVLLIGNMVVSVPAYSAYVDQSPIELREQDGGWVLTKGKQKIPVEIADYSGFHTQRTAAGRLFSEIALIHGNGCLGSTIWQACAFWGTPKACRFCGIGLSMRSGLTVGRKSLTELTYVAQAAEKHGIQHVVLTSGSEKDAQEIEYLADSIAALKQSTGLKVQAQCRPPRDLKLLNKLKESGADTLAINVESFDSDVLTKIAPNKAELGLAKYIEAWDQAVELFGKNQVISFVLVGLGETNRSLNMGVKLLAKLGVYPFLVPLRPIPATSMQDSHPPDPAKMQHVYVEAARIIKEAGLSWQKIKAGCGRCPACSALPDYEEVDFAKEGV